MCWVLEVLNQNSLTMAVFYCDLLGVIRLIRDLIEYENKMVNLGLLSNLQITNRNKICANKENCIKMLLKDFQFV